MQDNKLTIKIVNEQMSLTSKEPTTLPDLMLVLLTGLLQAMQTTVSKAPEEDRQAIKEDIYDMFNQGASNVLTHFAPDIEMRPDLTAQAILEKENEIIDREYALLKEKKAKNNKEG